MLWGSRRGRACYLLAIPRCRNESDLNRNKECFDFVTLYNISCTNFPCSIKKDNLKLKEKKRGGVALHLVNIPWHHGQTNIPQCMHTYGRYNVHRPIILVLTGNFKYRTWISCKSIDFQVFGQFGESGAGLLFWKLKPNPAGCISIL